MHPNDVIAVIGTIRESSYRFIRRELENHGMAGLAPSHGAILSELLKGREMTMGELSERIDRDRSTVTTLVRKLAEHGYVTRTQDPSDARIVHIGLSPSGRALENDFRAISRKLISTTYGGFSQEETEELASLLGRISENWERQ